MGLVSPHHKGTNGTFLSRSLKNYKFSKKLFVFGFEILQKNTKLLLCKKKITFLSLTVLGQERVSNEYHNQK